jgi:PilZ domain/Cyclic nucleotide-binding domain
MMKYSMSLPDEHQYSIMQRVLDGTLAVNSIDEFKEILEIYPEDALLHRKYADLLMAKSHLDDAVKAYDKAARLFIAHGMNLQAIVSKILQWSIQKPTHEQGMQFHRTLSNEGAQCTPLQRFWANMNYPESVTIMLRLVRLRLSAGDKIVCVDDPADEVYFVVSGTLAETLSPDCQVEASRAGLDTEPKLISANDVFGNIFPLDQPTASNTDIVAVTDVELVKIAKSVLADACKKHARIKELLLDIYKPENVEKCVRAWQTVRRATRYGLPTKVEISSAPSDPQQKDQRHTGIAVDLSLGGMCVDLGPATAATNHSLHKGQSVQVLLDLLNEVAILDLSATIVWLREQNTGSRPSILLGIRFDPLNATDRELLLEYCSGNVGEQNLLWSLWDSMVKPANTDKSNGR